MAGQGRPFCYDRVMKKRKINWEKIQTEYVTTDTSYRKLADKYKINVRRIQERGKADGWVALRQAFRAEIGADFREDAKEQGVKALNDIAEITGDAIEKIRELLVGVNNGTQTAALMEALRVCRELVRDIYGLPTLNEQHRKEMDLRRMEIEESKAEKKEDGGVKIEIDAPEGFDE